MIPAAVERAQALIRHAHYLGAPVEQFVVSVSKPEGYELMAWLRTDLVQASQAIDYTQLDKDIEHASQIDDPWFVLDHFALYGLAIVRREDLH